MKIVEEYEDFIEGARLDWLHPSNGRWPDLAAAIVDQNSESYLVAVWWDGQVYSVMVEGPDHYHSIIQSYRWAPYGKDRNRWWCRLDKGHMEDIRTEANRALRIRQIACDSCHLFSTCPS